ncbi:MAG: LysR family transcriptional regulator [Tepidisphaera sp.]
MEIHQLRYMVAVAETGSATRAAARCRVAQPSLSQQIAKLERSLGKRLFDRLGTGMALTDAGKAFLPRASRILAGVDEADAWAGRGEMAEAPSLAVGAIPTIAPYLLPAALAEARKHLPGCEFKIREDLTDNLVEGLLDLSLDCALMSTPPVDDRLDTETIGDDELLAVIPASWKDVPRSARNAVALAELRDQPAVLLDEVHCLGHQVEAFCSSRKLGPRVVCRTTQLTTILEMVSLGLGFSLVPRMAVRPSVKRRIVHLSPVRPKRPIVLAWRVGRTRSAASLALLAALAEALRSVQGRPGAGAEQRALRKDP